MLCKQEQGRLAVDLGLPIVCPEVHLQQHCQPPPWGLRNLGKWHRVPVDPLGSTGATSPFCCPCVQARCSLCNIHRHIGCAAQRLPVLLSGSLPGGNMGTKKGKQIKSVSGLQMPMWLWAVGMKAYWAKRGAGGRGEGRPDSVCMEITGRRPTDSRQLSLDPANGLHLRPPPSAVWLLSEAWQPRSYFRFCDGAYFLP